MEFEYSAETTSNMGAMGGVMALVWLAVGIFMLISMWKVFTKAGQPGWAVIVPIYNIVVMLQIAGKPIWWILLFFVPIANFVVSILIMIGMANNFGKGTGFALGMIFLPIIFYPMLAFGDAQYGVAEEAMVAEAVAE